MDMLFEASAVSHILTVGPLAYLAMIVLLRVSGKRALSKMNAFDFVVTVALGSILATVVLDEQVSLLEGVVAIAVLLVGQFVITFLSSRSKLVTKAVKANPVLVYGKDGLLESNLKQERVNREEGLAAVRNAGYTSLEAVDAVVLVTACCFRGLKGGRDSDQMHYSTKLSG